MWCFGHRNGKNVGPRDAAWGPVGPSVGQWTCVSRPEATGRLYHKGRARADRTWRSPAIVMHRVALDYDVLWESCPGRADFARGSG
jgi:hypothetical protein